MKVILTILVDLRLGVLWQEKIMKLNFHEIEFLLAEVPAPCVVLDMACLTRAKLS